MLLFVLMICFPSKEVGKGLVNCKYQFKMNLNKQGDTIAIFKSAQIINQEYTIKCPILSDGVCSLISRGVGRGGRRGRTIPPFWGQILYISYIKC